MGQLPFHRLHHSRNDQSFITLTGVDYDTFEYLLTKFGLLYLWYSPYSVNGKIVVVRSRGGGAGRPQSLDAAACLGLVLGYTRTRGSFFSLQMIFGATHSVLTLFLWCLINATRCWRWALCQDSKFLLLSELGKIRKCLVLIFLHWMVHGVW
jgi:hypothetical protein